MGKVAIISSNFMVLCLNSGGITSRQPCSRKNAWNSVHILSPSAAVELKQLVVNKKAGLGEEIPEAVKDKPKGILVVRQEKRRQEGKGMPAGDAQETADGKPQPPL